MSTDIQRAVVTDSCPTDAQILEWTDTVRARFDNADEVTIRLVDRDEMQALNRDYRNKDQPTNVLSFGVDEQTRTLHKLLGDIVICVDVVATEAAEQGKALEAHWAHMVTHGLLHLLGFDHIDDTDAHVMEAHEIACLAQHQINNPYSEVVPNIAPPIL